MAFDPLQRHSCVFSCVTGSFGSSALPIIAISPDVVSLISSQGTFVTFALMSFIVFGAFLKISSVGFLLGGLRDG
jgi:hypothetical protein